MLQFLHINLADMTCRNAFSSLFIVFTLPLSCLISSPSAQAADFFCGQTSELTFKQIRDYKGMVWNCGDKDLKIGEADFDIGDDSFIKGKVTFGTLNDKWIVDIVWEGGPSGAFDGFFNYEITAGKDADTLAQLYFDEVVLDARLLKDANPQKDSTFSKVITYEVVQDPTQTLTVKGEGKGSYKFKKNEFTAKLRINDKWDFKANDIASTLSNEFTQKRKPQSGGESVPGPLPLLGVGVAFSYSRRLRKRIKTGRTP